MCRARCLGGDKDNRDWKPVHALNRDPVSFDDPLLGADRTGLGVLRLGKTGEDRRATQAAIRRGYACALACLAPFSRYQ